MIHEILPVGLLQCNCSILGDEASGEALVIDPGDQVDDILEVLQRHRLSVTGIVVTHAHLDHIGGAQELKTATGAPVWLHPRDLELCRQLAAQAMWLGMPAPPRTEMDIEAQEGQRLRAGSTDLEILHTPGHTQGSISLWIPSEKKLLAGDTLFQDSIGRTDLPGGDHQQLIDSIQRKILALPDETVIYPGHGPRTTVARERRSNPWI